MTWLVFSIVLVVIIIVSTTVTIRYTSSNYTSDDGLHYAPTDTRIIPVNNALCEGLELAVDSVLVGYKASLSILNSSPKLSGSERFSISDSPYMGYNDYQYYYFYMYPGSKFTVSACISDGFSAFATFSMIKGHDTFDDWVDDPFPVQGYFEVNTLCSTGQNNSHTYNVKKEDYYYLVFEADHTAATQLDVNMSFHRTRYEVIGDGSTSDSCTVTGNYSDSCTVSVPLSGKTAFLTVSPETGTVIDWKDGIGLDTRCVPRVWMYVIIALSILVGLLLILVPLMACIIVKLRRKNKAASPAVAASNDVETTAETDTTPLFNSPPPINPHYQEPPPKYDGGFAPPAYKP